MFSTFIGGPVGKTILQCLDGSKIFTNHLGLSIFLIWATVTFSSWGEKGILSKLPCPRHKSVNNQNCDENFGELRSDKTPCRLQRSRV